MVLDVQGKSLALLTMACVEWVLHTTPKLEVKKSINIFFQPSANSIILDLSGMAVKALNVHINCPACLTILLYNFNVKSDGTNINLLSVG